MSGATRAPEPETLQPATRSPDRWQVLINVVLGAILALGASLVTTWVQLDAATTSQQAQFAEEAAREQRVKKAEVYIAFQDAANAYGNATEVARSCIVRAREAAAPDVQVVTLDEGCVDSIGKIAPARYEFQSARNQVFFYGSQAAEDQARAIAAYLPPAVGGDPESGLPELDSEFATFDRQTFSALYRQFNEIIRCEVPVEPRSNC